MGYSIKQEKNFKFLETSRDKEPLLLLHGLFGALSNFKGIIEYFSDRYNVVVPLLPIYEMPLRKTSLNGLLEYVQDFVQFKGYGKVHLLGNSLGGHLALLYTLKWQSKVKTITLTGSSGLFENSMGSTYPKRGDYEFVKNKTQATFYNPEVATKELVDEVYSIVNDRNKVLHILAMAKSAIRQNLTDRLHRIKVPTLIIWGKQDTVTPSFVGEKFNKLIANSKLALVDKCGHAPMMERPHVFNRHLNNFLSQINRSKQF